MERFHSIYIYISRGNGYSFSIIIENHYRLVIDLWCRYIGKSKYIDALRKAVSEGLKEYFNMGLGDIPVKIVLPRNKLVLDFIQSVEFEEIIKPFENVDIEIVDRWRYKRSVELARHCLKNKLGRYPPSKYL